MKKPVKFPRDLKVGKIIMFDGGNYRITKIEPGTPGDIITIVPVSKPKVKQR